MKTPNSTLPSNVPEATYILQFCSLDLFFIIPCHLC